MSTSSEDMTSKKFDFIVFGATGFTGKYMVKLIATRNDLSSLRWAIAGRNLEKLRDVINWVTSETGKDLKDVNVLCADINDKASLDTMCKSATLILNLVGPYMLYGENVVQACIENHCHHVDLCGNVQWLELLRQKHEDQAQKSGLYFVAACGFDSIPVEMGILYTKQQFPGILNRVEGYFSVPNGLKNSTVNFATLHSMLTAISNRRRFNQIMEKCPDTPLPEFLPKVPSRMPIFFSEDNDRWSAPTGTDEKMVQKTQKFLSEQKNERPVQYQACFSAESLGELLSIATSLVFLVLFSLCRCGRSLITKYPRFFTGGIFSHDGPTPEEIDSTSFNFNFYGRGFSSKEKEGKAEEDMKIITRVSGPEFAYIATTIFMLEAGLSILQEKDKLPQKGGMYSPGAAFCNTTIIERCEKQGIKFSVVSAAKKI